MPQYQCPRCETTLKRDEPIPAGKKIKCPKCATIFGPNDAPAAPKAAAKPKPKPPVDDDDNRDPYAVKADEGEDEAMKAEKERAAQGLIKDRFKKSKRGPALKRVVQPSNFLLACGVFTCIFALIGFVVGSFPLIFQDFYAQPVMPAGMKYQEWEEQKKKMGDQKISPADWRNLVIQRTIIMSICVFYFIVGSLICNGAFKMRALDSRGWGIAGAIIAIVTGLGVIPVMIGIWVLIVLNDPIVKDGFDEEKPPEV